VEIINVIVRPSLAFTKAGPIWIFRVLRPFGFSSAGKSPSGWNYGEHSIPGIVIDNSTSDVACDSYHRYKEDIPFLKMAGVRRNFRQSLILYVINLSCTVKTKPCFGKCYSCCGCETKTGVVRILVIFQDRPTFSHIIQKVLTRAFH